MTRANFFGLDTQIMTFFVCNGLTGSYLGSFTYTPDKCVIAKVVSQAP